MIQLPPAARIAAACTIFSATPSHGLGIEFTYHDPEVVARGNAGVASADRASAVYYNPAMLGTGEGSELLLAGYVLDYQIEHDGPGGHSEMEDGPAVAASAFAMTPLGERASLGFGLYSPFGQKNEWSDNSPLRSLATETELLFMAGTAALGFEVTPGLRLGLSASAVSSRADLNRGIVVPGDSFSLEGDGHGWGLGAGFTWEPSEHHRFGGTVRYWSPVKYKGHTTTRLILPAAGVAVSPAETELDFPVEATLGYAWMPDPKWLVEVDVTYTGWSSFDDFQVSSPGGNLVDPLRWEDTLTFMAGLTRRFDNGWWVGGGYWFTETTTPDLTFNPRLPDLDLHVVSLGAGYRTECWAAELTYQFGYGNSREITGGLPTLSGAVADGKMTYRAHGLSMGARWFF